MEAQPKYNKPSANAQGLQHYNTWGRGEVGSNTRYLQQIDSIRQQARKQRRPLILAAFTALYVRRGGVA